jgi:hypothetical protein
MDLADGAVGASTSRWMIGVGDNGEADDKRPLIAHFHEWAARAARTVADQTMATSAAIASAFYQRPQCRNFFRTGSRSVVLDGAEAGVNDGDLPSIAPIFCFPLPSPH